MAPRTAIGCAFLSLAFLALRVCAEPFQLAEGFENGLKAWADLEGKQSLRLVTDHVHGGKQVAFSGPPGALGVMNLNLPKAVTGRVTVWFYDDGAAEKQQAVALSSKAADQSLIFIVRGPGNYQARTGMSYFPTNVPRKVGWHEIRFDGDGTKTTLLIDGAAVWTNDKLATFNEIMLGSPWDASTGWYDDLQIDGRVLSAAEQAELDKRAAEAGQKAIEARLAALRADAATPLPQFVPTPYGHLGAVTPLAAECYRRLNRYVCYHQVGMKDWPTVAGCRYHKVDNHEEHAVRQNATTALCYATLLLEKDRYDAAASGLSYDRLEAEAKALIRYCALTHLANGVPTGDGKCWGDQWQSALWCRYAGHAAWLLWDRLDAETRLAVARMIEHEADRFNTRPPDNGVKTDTKAEENAWNAMVIALAGCMFPDHPRAALWRERAIVWQLNSFVREADRGLERVVDGKPAKERLQVTTIWPDYTLENHDRVHPDYLGCFALLLVNGLVYLPAGRPLPDSAQFNVPECWKVLQTLTSPNGSSYYINGQDWWPHRHDWPLSCAALTSALLGDPAGAYLERQALDFTAKMHARFDDGRLWEPREIRYPNAEEEMATVYAESYLLHRLAGDGPAPLTADQWLARQLGVHCYEAGSFAIQRSTAKTVSVAWANGLMGLVWPRGEDDTWFTATSETGLFGRITAEGLKDGTPQVLWHRAEDRDGGLAVAVAALRAEGAVEQRAAVWSPKDGPVTYLEQWIARKPVTVTSLDTGTAGIYNENGPRATPNRRVLHYGDKAVTIEGTSDAPDRVLSLDGTAANVDDRFGLVSSAANLAYRDQNRWQRARLEEEVIGCHRVALGHFEPGQVIRTGAVVLLPGATWAETAGLQVDVKADGEMVAAMAGRNVVVANFGEKRATGNLFGRALAAAGRSVGAEGVGR